MRWVGGAGAGAVAAVRGGLGEMGVNVESMPFLFRWHLQAGGSFKQHLQGFLTLIGLQQGAGVWQPALKSDEGLRFCAGQELSQRASDLTLSLSAQHVLALLLPP